ncbi:hypothetical protein LCGC14_0446850 [marine sediment metagenome]|uniref:Uncharacterized protein n=1 Tax=marine sediment metagenome TaxID=412755 RepID=A0A0F9SPP9_9ZZZZ
MTDDKKSIATLAAELVDAQSDYEAAAQTASLARSRQTDALNALNAAQSAVTDWYDTERGSAANATAWGQ